jgi:type III secretion protein C
VWLAAILCGVALQVQAAVIPFPSEQVSYDLRGEALQSFLKRFFDDVGIAVTLSDLVKAEPGTLNGPRSGNPAAVFRSIAESNGLVAYYDGSVAFIYKSRELSDRYFQLDPGRLDAFREATIGVGLPDINDTLKIKSNSGLVTARGTPRFLEQLAQLSSALTRHLAGAVRGVPSSSSRGTLRYIALKYAWAADTTFTVGNTKTVIPGVATILKQLLGQGNGGQYPTTSGVAPSSGLRGKGLAALSDRTGRSGTGAPPPPYYNNQAPVPGGDSDADASATLGTVTDSPDAPRIVADPYRNALIIRDSPDRMPMYEELVRKLDVESQIIQLDATVIDIDRSKVSQLGIDWSYQHGNTGVAFGGGINPVDAAGNLAGLQINSIISNASRFAARINALQTDGVTNIVQRPQVVTLNDMEAVIQSTQSVYVPVSGAYDEDLYNVMAGTVLRVTPHIIIDNGRQRIRLLVTIEDGSLTVSSQPTTMANGQTLTQPIPNVVNNAVNTQAIIDVGDGLLLGGLVRHEKTHTTQKVPVLGSIPLLGHLFRSDTVNSTDTERLFLISPTIVIASAARGTPAAALSHNPP